MANRVAREALYLTRDGRVVREGDPSAASLLIAKGLELTDAEVKQYGVEKYMTDAPAPYDAIAEHEAAHGGETPAQAAAARASIFKNAEKALTRKPNKADTPDEDKGT